MDKKDKEKQQKISNIKQAQEKFDMEMGEDSTKYGEFISSYFGWSSLEEQKKKAQELDNITKKREP